MERILGFVANRQRIYLRELKLFTYSPRRWYNVYAYRGSNTSYYFSEVAGCPFCGGTLVDISCEYRKLLQQHHSFYRAFVQCPASECRAQGPTVTENLYNDWRGNHLLGKTPSLDATDRAIKGAIVLWNTRRG